MLDRALTEVNGACRADVEPAPRPKKAKAIYLLIGGK